MSSKEVEHLVTNSSLEHFLMLLSMTITLHCGMSEKKMSEKYILSAPTLSLSRQAFYGDADGVSLREYKCQTRLI